MSSFPLTYPVSPQPPPFCSSVCLTSRLLLVCLLSICHPDYLLCLSPTNLSVSQSYSLPFCLPVCPYVSCFVFLSACLPCLSTTLPFCTSDCLPFYLLVCLSVFCCPSFRPAYPVCPKRCLSDHLSVCMSNCLPSCMPD